MVSDPHEPRREGPNTEAVSLPTEDGSTTDSGSPAAGRQDGADDLESDSRRECPLCAFAGGSHRNGIYEHLLVSHRKSTITGALLEELEGTEPADDR